MDEAHRNLAGILLVQREYAKAIESYKIASRFDPYNAKVCYFMEIAFQEQGNIEQAQPWLDKVSWVIKLGFINSLKVVFSSLTLLQILLFLALGVLARLRF